MPGRSLRGARPNLLLSEARRRHVSPSGSGRAMSRQELAEAVNSYLWTTYRRRVSLDGGYIGKLERGDHRWPALSTGRRCVQSCAQTETRILGFSSLGDSPSKSMVW